MIIIYYPKPTVKLIFGDWKIRGLETMWPVRIQNSELVGKDFTHSGCTSKLWN